VGDELAPALSPTVKAHQAGQMSALAIYRSLTNLLLTLIVWPRRFDLPGRFPFHQVGHPRLARYLWPLEQVFQPPRFAFGIASLGRDNNCFTDFALSGNFCRKGFE
jgi:hypothetical protein